MSCGHCSNDTESNSMNGMCGIEMKSARCPERVRSHRAPKGQDKPAWGNAPGRWYCICSRALKGRNILRSGCSALSGLGYLWGLVTQGVALGWFVDAPSGRYQTGSPYLRQLTVMPVCCACLLWLVGRTSEMFFPRGLGIKCSASDFLIVSHKPLRK